MAITMYYDKSCRLCSGLAKKFEHVHEVQAVPTEVALPAGVSKEEAARDVHVVDGTRIYKGADAVIHVLEQDSRWRLLARIAQLPLVRQCVRALYRIVADNRHRF